MRKAAIPMLAALLLALPGLADANKAHKAVRPAVQACKQERSADPAAFKAKYANKHGKHAFRRCVARHVHQAVKTCRAERKSDPAAFKAKYANTHGKHAFRRCVHQHESDPVS